MSFEPNSEQELPRDLDSAEEMQQEPASSETPEGCSPEDNAPAVPEEYPSEQETDASPQEISQEDEMSGGGAFIKRELPQEEEDTSETYHGRFSAKPSSAEEPQDSDNSYPADYPQKEVEEAPVEPEAANSEEIQHPYGGEAPSSYGEEPQEPYSAESQPEPYQGEPEGEAYSPAPQPPRRRAVKKGRPRRKKGEGLLGIPNILVTVVWVVLALLIGVSLGRLAWVCASEILAFGREDKTVTITIYETDTLDDIINKLERAELIHYPGLFRLYAEFAVDDGDIQPGIWELNTKYDYHALVLMMSPSSSRDVVKVMIPEGYSCRQIFELLEENKVCTVQDIEAYAASGELDDYWFLEGVSRGDRYCLEGFLFPDTYEFYENDTPKNVLTKMLDNFDTRFDEDMRGKIQTLNNHLTDLMQRNGKSQDYINSHLFTVKDVVTVASMIEKEAASAEEGYTIASVIYNRLFNWGDNPAYLNIDATIIYALDGKTDLTSEDLQVDSPYNTYTNTGLTPGPIANPGLTTLEAALEPSETNYYYYVLDPSTGTHVFATTQEEHDANRANLGY